jgi:hypothetical protein
MAMCSAGERSTMKRKMRIQNELPVDRWTIAVFIIVTLPVSVLFLIMLLCSLLGVVGPEPGPGGATAYLVGTIVVGIIAVVVAAVRGGALFHAIRLGSLPAVREFVENGKRVRGRTLDGRTPLHEAAKYSRLVIVRFILDEGASPNVSDILGRTPLHFARLVGSDEIATLLLERGAMADARDWRGRTPDEAAGRRA